jgi:hypothetical protein
MKRQPWSWKPYNQQRQNRYQQQVLYPKSTLTPMANPWVQDTLVRKSRKWRLGEACELGAKHSRGVQTDAVEDALWSQWGTANPKKTEALRRRRWREPSREPSSPNYTQRRTVTGWTWRRNRVQATDNANWQLPDPKRQRIPSKQWNVPFNGCVNAMNSTNYWDKPRRGVQTDVVEDSLWSQRGTAGPRKTEAPRRRGLLPTGQGIADSWASVVRGNLNQRSQGQPRTSWTRRWNSAPATADTAEWHMADPRTALRKSTAGRRRLREPSREPSFLQHEITTWLPPVGQEWRFAVSRKQRVSRKRRNVPAERHAANVEKVTNYWNVLQPWHRRRTTVDHVGKASAFQRVDTIGRDQNFTASCRGQPMEAGSGCQRRPPCPLVKRTYQSSSTCQNTHTHTHTHTTTSSSANPSGRFPEWQSAAATPNACWSHGTRFRSTPDIRV